MAAVVEPTILEMTFADGAGELSLCEQDPLVAVFRRAIRTGSYSGSWLYLIARPSAGLPPKLLGTIAWTPGERLLYFPGFHGSVVTRSREDPLNGGFLDHVTLELDPTGSKFEEHIAILGERRRTRGRARRGSVLPGHLHPWFSLLRSDLERYQDLPAKYRFQLVMPTADVARRCRAMMGTSMRTDVGFPDPSGDGPHYYQVDVWAGRGEDWAQRYANALPWAITPGVVDDHRCENLTRVAQWHALAPGVGVIVVLTRPSGSLRVAGLLHPDVTPVASAALAPDAG